jgi:hypothetical protein
LKKSWNITTEQKAKLKKTIFEEYKSKWSLPDPDAPDVYYV